MDVAVTSQLHSICLPIFSLIETQTLSRWQQPESKKTEDVLVVHSELTLEVDGAQEPFPFY